MPNGTGLIGNTSAGQCALIVPIPCDPNKYVIFHVTEFSNPGYLSYTVVDMSLNSGLGDVVSTQKNISLGTGWTEKLCAYYNASGNNYWVLTHKWNSDQFVAFNVNATSIASSSVTSSIGSTHNCGSFGAAHDAMGQLTISPDGTKVINALTCQDKFELFDFNVATGALSNSISITGTGGNAWGTAFSADSKRIYTDAIFGTSVLQYDINTYTQAAILASQYTVAMVSSPGYNFGYMELGPDNKLYIAKPGNVAMSVVNSPTVLGAGCNFSIAGQSLGVKISNHGISRIAYNIPPGGASFSISASPNATIGCASQTITLAASPTLTALNYTWSGAGIIGSNIGNSVQVISAGVYTCVAPICSGSTVSLTYTIVSSGSGPSMSISVSAPSLCAGNTATMTAIGASNYTWQPVNLTGSLVSVSPTVSTNYTVTGTNTLGCLSNSLVSISVFQSPTLGISPVSSTVCAGKTVTFTQTGANSYTWQPGNFPTSASQIVFTPTASVVYTVTGQSSQGCAATVYNSVTVNPLPSLTVSPVTSTVCNSSSITFSAYGAASYTWLPSGNTGSVISLPPQLNNSTYTLAGMSAQGCSTTVLKSLTVVPSPTVIANSTPSIICAGAAVTLSSSGATSYTWYPGNLTGQTITVTPQTTMVYTVVGLANGCTASSSILVSNPLNPTVTSSGNIDCNNSLVQLFVSSTSTIHNILWTGSGIISAANAASVQVNAAGIYSVTITNTVTGCSATNTLSVLNTIGPIPITIIPSSALSCYPGPPVNLLIGSSANFTWFPSSAVTPSTGPFVTVNPSVTTVYTVVATLGICSGSAAISISVNVTPTLNVSTNSGTLCEGSSTTLSANGAATYVWNPGNLTGASVTVSPVSTTVFTLTGANNNCQSSATTTLEVFPVPNLIVSVSPSVLCAGNAATLSAAGTNTVAWLPGATFGNSTTISVSPLVSTVYTASGTNSLGCSSSATVFLNVVNTPTLNVTSSAATVCASSSVTLSANGAANYLWMPINQTGSVVVATPSISTTYTVFSENSGCTSYTTLTVLTEECLTTGFGLTKAVSKAQLIHGTLYKIDFMVTAVNNSTQLLRDITLTDDLTKAFPYPCTYSVTGIPKMLSSGSKIQTNPFFDGNSDFNLSSPSTSTLLAGKRDTLVFSVMLDPHGFYGSLKNTATGSALTENNILLKDSSNAGFAWDPDQDGDPTNNNEPTPFEIDPIELFIPEGFSPNEDGNYDFFEIKGLNGRRVNITIFNRWGNKVYVKENYDNSWDGKVNVNGLLFGNEKLPEGTYYYLISFLDGKNETISGFVVLRY